MVAVPTRPRPSFEAMVGPRRQELITYARRLCRSTSLAEDLVQDALLRAFEAWDRFEIPSHGDPVMVLRGWLFTIVHNRFVQTWRAGKIREHLNHQQRPDYAVDPSVDPRGEVDDERFGDEVVDALADLEPDQRRVVLMATDGRSYKEIAAELGVPIGTVMSRLHRARARLEAQLADYAEDYYGLVMPGSTRR